MNEMTRIEGEAIADDQLDAAKKLRRRRFIMFSVPALIAAVALFF